MEIIEDLVILPTLKSPVVTSGTFDGVHFGHRKILQTVHMQAKERQSKSVVITYWPHPRYVIASDPSELRLLSTFEEKAKLISQEGIDYLIKIPFTREFSQLSSSEFVNKILIETLNTGLLVIGYDHRFGKDREGSFDYLINNQKKLGFDILEISHQDVDHVTVSSTKIRHALSEGDLHTATEYLGRPYSFSGIVVRGDQLGRKLGFPTANILLSEQTKLIPADGVYFTIVNIDQQKFFGMLNIGHRPTINGINRQLEVHILNFSEDIYGKVLHVSFLEKMRNEVKFESLESLKSQLEIDKLQAVQLSLTYEN